ncbi:farnesyl-protein transferase alpha-subunit [Nannochloropsis gaditana CCMP526]|uniref:farnesyl-protein transferase alpha-subunit n=1 Tax=Nannochloropsis gaditana (strain CCMP526) TaxID=1093141 RepID=UPI00029F6ACD|nr:farnesyl-protein transferase alpha-subunit [Nannochloropsis gaditana CCMP526]EKU20394.1 farnesyl-protein transferase alpha-subunit [Nannochloropsis gaditana CCMP526]|eukprot:XP_005855951.1 farnesyl-protein transferase alpha-subunit [Nannochloropsis gaditana CCMP526]
MPTSPQAMYVPFSHRLEWQDVTPIPQDDLPASSLVVPIDYPDEYRDATEYMRAALVTGERSRRVHSLAGEVIEMNAAHYTAWWLRRRCLEAMVAETTAQDNAGDKEMDEAVEELYDAELAFALRISDENPKNYQVWFHRQTIIAETEDPAGELEISTRALRKDAKNYHVWAYRQWLLKTFQAGWEEEMAFVDTLLKEDRR